MASAANLKVFPNKIEVDYCTGTLSQVDADGCTALYTVSDNHSASRPAALTHLTVVTPNKPIGYVVKPSTVAQGKDFGPHTLHTSQPSAPHTSWSAA